MAALAGHRFNAPPKAFADRLEAAGKPAKVILIVVAKKLPVIVNALLRDMAPWDPERPAVPSIASGVRYLIPVRRRDLG